MNLDNLEKNELIKIIQKLNKSKKFGLLWNDNKEDIVDNCKKNHPFFENISKNNIINSGDGLNNYFIEGDNYHSLSVLNYTHRQKIDFIYIDPPYNTGARDWKYNNDYVDSEDSYRHSKWLSFMHNRLKIAKNLLKKDGVICLTIDNHELPRIWLVMDEVFGHKNFLGEVIIRNNPASRNVKGKIALTHEYALFYGRSMASKINKFYVNPENKTHKYEMDKNGKWFSPTNLRKTGVDNSAIKKNGQLNDRHYPIYVDTKTGEISTSKKLELKILPINTKNEKVIWRRSKEEVERMYRDGECWFHQTSTGGQIYYKFYGGTDGESPKSIWFDPKYSASEHGTPALTKILGKKSDFPFPKSIHAVEDCISIGCSSNNGKVLDFFAGSGTTAEAVSNLNKKYNKNLTFILCTNNENNIAKDVCFPRCKNSINKTKRNNLYYFRNIFLDDANTDDFKFRFVLKSIDMLCAKEETFKNIINNDDYKVFENDYKKMGVLINIEKLNSFKKDLIKDDKKTIVYMFTLHDDNYSEEFDDVKNVLKVSPIPQTILKIYRRINKN